MDFLELASKRYSARNFKELPIPQMIIDKILLAGNVAPTAHNYQPQKIIVVNSQEGLRRNAQNVIIMRRLHLLFVMIGKSAGNDYMIIKTVAI